MSYYTPKNYAKQSLTSSLSLNSSLNLNLFENDYYQEKSFTQRKRHQRQFSDRSFISQNQQEQQNKIQKKKMGIQLGILQKQILGQSQINLIKRNRNDKRILNRSNFMKQKQQKVSSPATFLTKQKQIFDKQITSQNLQQIRKIDKTLYQLYINLFQDIKQLTETNKNYNNSIVNLQTELKQAKSKKQSLQNRLKNLNENKIEVENDGKRIQGILLSVISAEVENIET